MSDANDPSFRPYQRRIILFLLLVGLISLVLINVIVYLVFSHQSFQDTRDTLKQAAVAVAKDLPVAAHERLIEPSQQTSADYLQIEKYFQDAKKGNPMIDDIYTLRPTDQPHKMIFVVSGQITQDTNGDGVIGESEEKPVLGELYETADLPDLEAGLEQLSVDQKITYDKWGAWLSGYAPIRTAESKSVGLLGIDYSAQIIRQQRGNLLESMLITDAIIAPFFIILIILIAQRLSRPFRILAQGLSRVSQGDVGYQLPLKHRGEERVFVDLFNNIVTMFADLRKRSEKNNLDKK